MATRKKATSSRKTQKKPSAKRAKKTVKTKKTAGARKKTKAKKPTKPKTKKPIKSKTKKAAKKTGGKSTRKAVGKTTGRATKKAARKPAVASPGPAAQATKTVKAAPKPKKITMPAKKRREFRAMLMGLKARLVEQIATLKNDSLTRHEPINPEEDGTVAFDRQFALNLVSTERESLFEIDDALRRIEDRTYGVCEECGELIGESRLRALPFVGMCVGCQSAKEKGKVRFTPMFG